MRSLGDRIRWELTLLKLLARPVLWLYHSRKSVYGNPTYGPRRIVAFSHPFHLLDPAHVHLSLGRGPLYYLADSVILFGTPWSAWLSRRCRALPLHRRESGKTDRDSQRENLRFLQEAIGKLAGGASIAIAPEGRSTAQRTLWRFKAGLSRLAFETATEHGWPEDLRIVLVGITYRRMRRPYDGSVTIALDEPVRVADWRARHERDARTSEREFLDDLEERMRALTVDFAGLPAGFVEDMAELLDADARAAGRPLERDDRVTLRAAVALVDRLEQADRAAKVEWKRDLALWLSEADRLLLRPGSEARRPTLPPPITLLLELPTVVGFLLWWPGFALARKTTGQIARERRPKHRSRAGTQELFAILRVFALWFLALGVLVTGLVVSGVLPRTSALAGLAALLALGALARKRHRHARLAWLRCSGSSALRAFEARGRALRVRLSTLRESSGPESVIAEPGLADQQGSP